MTDERAARQAPSLAILGAFAHARGDNALVTAEAAMSAIAAMHEDRRGVYFDLILGALDEAVRRDLEAWMDFKNYEYKSDFAKRYLAQGKTEGKAEGKAEGELEGARAALLDVIGARGLRLDDDARTRIESCKDLAQLRAWIARAAVADTGATIFELPT